jgi:hypothetical protein
MGELIIHVSVNYAKLAGFTGAKPIGRLDSQLETFRSRFFLFSAFCFALTVFVSESSTLCAARFASHSRPT